MRTPRKGLIESHNLGKAWSTLAMGADRIFSTVLDDHTDHVGEENMIKKLSFKSGGLV